MWLISSFLSLTLQIRARSTYISHEVERNSINGGEEVAENSEEDEERSKGYNGVISRVVIRVEENRVLEEVAFFSGVGQQDEQVDEQALLIRQ